MSVTVLRPAGTARDARARTRFALHRAGLIGLYEYENETFEFERGRLLLRGPNGAGKSKALELLLPLLLDGELRAERLDPFGGRGRSMRWNLIGEEESRAPATGFSWLELCRRDEDGHERFVTLVLMVRADKGDTGVKSWFALLEAEQPPAGELHGPRIGVNTFLTHGRQPLTKQAFAELAGELMDSASSYRERVNTLLFGVTQDRYEAIVRLLLSLRKPQLSQTLDPQELSARLTEALPELDRDAVLRVSARLDQLDRLREEAAELHEVRTAVASFARTYRDWARAALRERGGKLAEAVREGERRREALERTQAALTAARGRRSALASRQQQLEREQGAARAAERELRSSEDWRAAERLEELRRLAGAAEHAAMAAADELSRAQSDADEAVHLAELAEASLGRQQAAVARLLDGAAERAARAGVATHEAAVAGLVEERRELDAVAALLDDLAAARERALAALLVLSRELGVAQRAYEAARSRFEDAEAHQRERQADRARADDRLALIRDELIERLETWLADVTQLHVDEQLGVQLAERFARAGEPGAAPASELLRDRAAAAEHSLHHRRARLAADRAALAAEREPLAAERARLEGQEDPVPDPLVFRTAPRAGRDGAPFWALVDFAPGLGAEQQAGLEGALEGAGLLDAWVMPDGAVLDADDAVLVPRDAGGPAGDRTLAGLLIAVPAAPVPPEVVAGVLAQIGITDPPGLPQLARGGTQAAAIALDGGFALGPLRGRHRIEAARYIGASARAANRARRLAELARALAGIEQRDRTLAAELADLERRFERLREELRRFPEETAAVRAYVQLERARAEERSAAQRTVSEQQAMAARAGERDAIRERALAHARENSLPAPGEEDALDAVREAVSGYRAACAELMSGERLRRERSAAAAGARRQTERAVEAHAAARERERGAAQEQSARGAAHREAVATVGASVEQVRARLASLQAACERAEAGLRETQKHAEVAAADEARADTEASHAQSALSAAHAAVEVAHGRVARVGGLGAWSLALGDDAPEDHASAGGWPLERTLAAWRAVPREALATRRGWQTLMSDVEREADELRHRLSANADFLVSRERVAGDSELTLVEVRHGGRSHPVGELERWLEDELAARERTMADEDRRLFESFLVGGLADALRERIGGAAGLVAGMNEALAGCATSSGMGIELEWRPREHDDPGLREAVGLLRRDVALAADDARARLVEFLRGRIEQARRSLEQGSSTEHVMSALDYRAWHEFRVIQLMEGRREVLTRRRHQQGSGGEKAVALHLPLFAAAAAQFAAAAAPDCPRMILLDEAFAGIDERMRAQLLGLLERFDLDFVLTSHELWGCYPELSALGIYHLHREPGIPGVATAHFRWDGHRRVEVMEAR